MRILLSIVLALAFVAGARADTYPSRPVTLVVPYPAGGPSDTLARILVDALRGPLGQPIIVENIGGAGGSIGAGRVARATPDGYTLILGHVQTHVMNAAAQNLQFDVVKDFEPVSLVADSPQWLVVRKTFPANDLKEAMAWLKANPGKATAGVVGIGGPPDVAAIYFQKHTGTAFQLVPYRGGAPMNQDLIAGQIDMTFGQAASTLGSVRNGQLKVFAVLAGKRWWAAPEVPTIDEAGGPDLHSSFWHGLWAPKGTPPDIVAKINAALVEALADPTLQKRCADIGQEIFPREQQNPQALLAQQKAQINKWWPIIKAAGLKSD